MTSLKFLLDHTNSSSFNAIVDREWTSDEVLDLLDSYAHTLRNERNNIEVIRGNVIVGSRAIRSSYTLEPQQPLRVVGEEVLRDALSEMVDEGTININCEASREVEEVTRGHFYVPRIGRNVSVGNFIITVDQVDENNVVCLRKVTYLDEDRSRVFCTVEKTNHPEIAAFDQGWGQFLNLRTIKQRRNDRCFLTGIECIAEREYNERVRGHHV